MAEGNLASAPGLGPVDGVVAVDPVGLAALLRLTGPVSVAGWPELIDADNVVRITLHDAYTAFDNDQPRRIDFLTDVAQATWARLRQTAIPMRPDVLRGLGDAIASRRFIFHMTRRIEQQAIASVNADGALKGSDTFALVTQNTAPNKMDYWLKRSVGLTFRLRENGSAAVSASVVLRNGGTVASEPTYVAGPFDERFKAGWEQQFVSLYVPRRAVDRGRGDDVPVGAEEEPGFKTASTSLDIAPLEEERLRTHFAIPSIWDAKSGDMRIKFRRQPTLAPDRLRVEVVAPDGWHIVGENGRRTTRAIFRSRADRDIDISFKLAR
jgi:hypothetical protein